MTMVFDDAKRQGIFAWFGLPIPLDDRLKMIRDAGFGATSIWWEEDDPVRRKLRYRAPELVSRCGLALDNIHVPFKGCNALWSRDDVVRRRMVDLYLGWIDDCATAAVPVMVMHACAGLSEEPPSAKGLDSFRELTERAEGREVVLAVENTRSVEHLNALFRAIPSRHLGLCYDTGHGRLAGNRGPGMLRAWRNRLVTTHVSDNDGYLDRHWIPGHGVVDFEALGTAARWSELETPLMLEVHCWDKDRDPVAFLDEAHASARATRRRLTGAGEGQLCRC